MEFDHLYTELFASLFNYGVINNTDDVRLKLAPRRQCDQQRNAVGPAIHIVVRPSNGRTHCPRPSVCSIRV